MNGAKVKKRSKHTVWIVWGEEDTILENGENCIAGYEFDASKEVEAFLLGVSAFGLPSERWSASSNSRGPSGEKRSLSPIDRRPYSTMARKSGLRAIWTTVGWCQTPLVGCFTPRSVRSRPASGGGTPSVVSCAATTAIVEVEKKRGLIDKEGRFVVPPEFTNLDNLSEGRAFFGRAGHQGYLDETGRVVIEPVYAVAKRFTEGLAAVCLEQGK